MDDHESSAHRENGARRGLRQNLGFALGIALFLGILCAPCPEGMSAEGKRVAAITAWMAAWWITEAVPIPVTALLPLGLFPLLGILESSKVAPTYADHIIFLFLGGFFIALAMEKHGLHQRLALNLIRALGVSPGRLLLGFMLATAFISMWISNTATAMMMFPIGTAVVSQMAGQVAAKDPEGAARIRMDFGCALMLGIAYSASIGGMGTLIGTAPNLIMVGFVRKLFPQAPEVSFLQWMALGVPIVCLLLPTAWIYLDRVISRPALKKVSLEGLGGEAVREELATLGRMKPAERGVLLVFLGAVVLWVTRTSVSLGSFRLRGWAERLFGDPASVSDTTVAIVMGLLLFVLPIRLFGARGRGETRDPMLLDWGTVARGVPWGLLLLFGGGFAIAEGFQKTGLAQYFAARLQGLHMGPVIVLIAAACFIMTFLTEVTSNTAVTTMAMPVMAAAAVAAGIHPFMLMFPAAISASCAFMLPVATPPNAIVFGSGWVTIPRMARTGLFMNLVGVVLVSAVVYLLAPAVFDLDLHGLPAWAKP